MKRTIIIGDVHGCHDELVALLEKCEPRSTDQFVFVGDLVDRGPKSVEVVRSVQELADQHDVVVLEGNHEAKHRKFRENYTDAEVDDLADILPKAKITQELSEENKEFMESFVLFHRIEEHDVLVVHGGIPGNMTEFPLTLEEVEDMSRNKRDAFSKIIYTRKIDAKTGKFLRLKESTDSDPFWAETYDGRFGHVVFGHEPFVEGIREFPHATGIDTGAVFGGSLTAMILEGTKPHQFISVPSHFKFKYRKRRGKSRKKQKTLLGHLEVEGVPLNGDWVKEQCPEKPPGEWIFKVLQLLNEKNQKQKLQTLEAAKKAVRELV